MAMVWIKLIYHAPWFSLVMMLNPGLQFLNNRLIKWVYLPHQEKTKFFPHCPAKMEIYTHNRTHVICGWVLQYLLKHILWSPGSKDRHSNHHIPSFNCEIHATHSELCANCFISCKVEQLRQDLHPKAAYTSHFRQIKRLLRGRTNKYICQEAGAKASVWHHG